MTVSEAEEQEPLLVGANGHNKKIQGSYNALCSSATEKEVANALTNSDCGIYLEKLPSYEWTGEGSSPSGSTAGDELIGIQTERVTYTWHEINVFTSGPEERRKSLWRGIKNLVKREKLSVQCRKHILKNVNGAVYPGELTAIMGSSGAGKTTLLNTLTFRSSSNMTVTGMRAVNGYPVSRNAITSLSAYVQQEDLFIGTLTVREQLIFQALVRMDRDISYHQRMLRVNQVISEMSLGKCEDTMIGVPGRIKGISGGEMKRLSFACEVLTDPAMLFCDEPTSGLDSFMAQNVVSVLKSMAMKGKTVVCTIHQPSSEMFAMFDKVVLVSEGRIAYHGRSDEALTFFKELGAVCPVNYNPADFFIQLLAVVPNREQTCRDTIEVICDSFDKSPVGLKLSCETEVRPEIQVKAALAGGWNNFEVWDDQSWSISDVERSPYKASWCAQFRAVLWRSWLSVIKEPMLIKVRMIQTVMVALVICLIFFNQELNQDGVMNINGALFLFLTNMTFQNVFSVISVFCSELPIFLREHFNGMYRVDVYFLSKTLAEAPIYLVIPVLFTAISYYVIGLNPKFEHFLNTAIIIWLVANVAVSFGYLISCVSSTVTMALSLGPPIIIPFLLFGGFFLNSRSVPVYFIWLSYLSWFKYGNEALQINQWADIDHIDCTGLNDTCPKNGEIVLEMYNFDKSHFYLDIACLVLLNVVFRFLAYLALLSRTFRKE